MTADERLQFHQAESGPTMDRLRDWLKRQIDEKMVEPHSGLGAAIQYLRKHWEKLTLFLRKAGAPLDNNVVERALKKAILHRKNAAHRLGKANSRGILAKDVVTNFVAFLALPPDVGDRDADRFEHRPALAIG